ncbi:MAG: DUF4344 domain-containing metallopeptidase [Aliishimia sp.]
MNRFAVLCALMASPAFADDGYVESNLLSILYHELGHAIIDLAEVPIFGQEEDAADVASVLLIDMLYDEDAAIEIAYEAAFGFLAEAEATSDGPAYWDVHGPDLQRYYNLVCLFAGAEIEARADVADELGLPSERTQSCEEEFELANDSWGPVFDALAQNAPGKSLEYVGEHNTLTEKLISQEVASLNQDFEMPQRLTVVVESCGEANAFYDPNMVRITICSEFEDWLSKSAP